MTHIVYGAALIIVAGLAASQAVTASNEEIFQSCKTELKFSDSACQCILDKVESELSPEQQQMLAIMIKGDNSAITQAMAQGKISAQDMMVLTNFMTQTPAQCENQ